MGEHFPPLVLGGFHIVTKDLSTIIIRPLYIYISNIVTKDFSTITIRPLDICISNIPTVVEELHGRIDWTENQ